MAADYYQVLGVSRDASAEDLQRAYRTLARRNHPDVNKDPAAEERFKEINEAYHVLADPKLRARYDRYGPDFRSVPEGYDERFAGAGAGFRGGPGRGRPRSTGRAGGGFEGYSSGGFAEGGVDIEDLFSGLFGGGGRGFGQAGPAGFGPSGFGPSGFGPAGPMAGADQEAQLELSLEEAYEGGRRRITLDSRGYEVNIPPGVIEGQRIRLSGEGGRGRDGGSAGDLYLSVHIRPNRRYRLNGRDITTDLPLAPWEAALGATVTVSTPGGEAKVNVPAGSSSGRRLRLRGHGMPNPRGTPGDFYAEVRIAVPDRLSDRERQLFEELARLSTFEPRRSG